MHLLTDANVFVPQLAQDKRRILITMDKDFSNILLYPPGDHYGIIIVKLYRLKVAEATKIFLDSMKDIDPEDISKNLVLIDRNKTRIRKEKL